MTTEPSTSTDGVLELAVDAATATLNRVAVTVVSQSSGVVVASHTLDLNERLGFDASTTAALDTPNVAAPHFAPVVFSRPVHTHPMVIPAAWLPSDYAVDTHVIYITARDTYMGAADAVLYTIAG